ncbi:hypothetical protein C1645_750128 [Glomus cerebriforme]|uniref:Uncharacterized protein n=1 Tax=Glomus cerebriforme TaxID=658196 RepID=A0A397TN93_9GLOM|nr:hypothetical protein C1645_750128 [Glomus cerebriforme]
MALPQKKRFTFFGSPPMSPILSPTKSLSTYFSFQEKPDDKLANADDVRKAVDNLERLVVAAEAYRDLVNKLSKASKTLSKTLKDYGNSKGMENVHGNKDEKNHNDYVGDLDKQLKKMSKDYEKKTKKDNKASLESHNQYMNSITTLGSEIARAQKDYAEKVAKREKRTHSVISQIVCKLAEGHFAYFNESLKKCGPTITKMKEWAPFAGEDMPPPQDLEIFLDDQETQSQSDKNSTSSEKKPVSIASISEKQIAAMNYSHESKLKFNEETENISAKYVQMPEPKFPVITTPETTKPTYARPHSLVLDGINILNSKNDENTNSSSPTSSVPSTPIVQPTPALPVYTSPFDSKSLDLISKFSIGIRDDDNLYLRDEKVVEVHHPEVFIENKVEKNVLNQHFKNHQEEKANEIQNVTNDVEKNDEKKDQKEKNREKKDNEKSTKVQNEDQPENKDITTFVKRSPLEIIIHNRNSASDSSNSTLNDDKKNENSNRELKIDKQIETKKEALSEKPHENNETIKLISETINKLIKDEEKEITNEKKLLNNKNNFTNDDDSSNKSVNQISSQIPSENPKFIPSEFPSKNKETSSSSRSPLQVPRQIEYDNDYRKEYSREDTELYNDEIRVNKIHRDESLFYNNSLVHGERMSYNDTNLNYHRTQQYIDDDYESFDYIPSQNHVSYVTRDRSPPRSYSQGPYNNNISIPPSRGSSVREMTNRFQSMNEERRSVSPSTRNIPIQKTGRVSEITSRFGERRNKREEIINPLHISNSRNGYDDRYNEPIEYRNDRYIQYDDLHNGITPVRHCNCHNCRMAIEDSIHNNLMNSNRLPSRHNNPAPFNPRTDSDFARKNYR